MKTKVFPEIFNLSNAQLVAPCVFIIIPQKRQRVCLNECSPVALTWCKMKCFETLVRDFIISTTTPYHTYSTTQPGHQKGGIMLQCQVLTTVQHLTLISFTLTTKLEDLGLTVQTISVPVDLQFSNRKQYGWTDISRYTLSSNAN